jgi:hypothetical protein
MQIFENGKKLAFAMQTTMLVRTQMANSKSGWSKPVSLTDSNKFTKSIVNRRE